MRLPSAPAAKPVNLRGDYSNAGADYVVEQRWSDYTPDQHALWSRLLERQLALVKRYGAPQVLAGLEHLSLDGLIPRFDAASQVLKRATGWQIVAVPGLIPEAQFFAHLAERHFPVTVWLRTPEEIDYLAEPDVFHDFFGHVPLLCDQVFADFVQAYGVAGRKAAALGGLKMLARLYWYCVEFGLIKTGQDTKGRYTDGRGLKAYGAGILSSAGETAFSVDDPRPHRIEFELERVMRTEYLIDAYQKTYFVVDSFEQLFHSAYSRDFAPIYRAWADSPGLAPDALLPTDRVLNRGIAH
jgi:phenylalanine-4-hydroxylase